MTVTPSKKQVTTKSIEDIVKEQTVEKLLDDVIAKPNLVNLLAFLRLQDDCIIRWNELKRHIETSDKGNNSPAVAMDPTLADVFLADKWKINAPSKRAEHCLKAVALENAFNPVREYLESLRHLDLPEVTNEQLADCFGFNVEDNLSIDLMRLHLRACASRGINPGEKMDSLLIIQGESGQWQKHSH
jgi:predicted P-loop ATPase